MKPTNKEFLNKSFASIISFLGFSLLFGGILTQSSQFTLLFLSLLTPYLIMVPIGRLNVNVYLVSICYTMTVSFVCLMSAIAFTLVVPSNAMYYYGLSTPLNYITALFCITPIVALLIHMLLHGCKDLDTITISFIETRKKINLKTQQYFMNQKLNMLRDITKKNIYDSKFESFLQRHAGFVFRTIMIASSIGPVIPLIISRNFGQQPVEYFFLLCNVYMAALYSYFLPITIHTTRAVIYIQKKHEIKLKLAYKDDKDIVIV